MPNKFRLKSFGVFFVVIAVILLLIFFNFRGWLKIPKDLVGRALTPVLKVSNFAVSRVSGGLNFLTTLKNVISENYNLKQENQKLWQENSVLKEAAREDEILRQRLALGPVQGRGFVLASIIGYNQEAGQYFLIDKGAAQGLAVNQPVVTANNFLIGKIAAVNQYSAQVLLVIDSNSLINALTQESRASGIVKGAHGLGLVMEMIPIDKKVQAGETVLTSGRDDALPAGLIIGSVSQVILKEADIFQQAIVEPAVKFKDLESVFVIK